MMIRVHYGQRDIVNKVYARNKVCARDELPKPEWFPAGPAHWQFCEEDENLICMIKLSVDAPNK